MNNPPRYTELQSPHDLEAEKVLLGGILRDPDTFDSVRALVGESSFYHDAHQRIFAALSRLADARKPLDLVALADELTRAQALADVGGAEFLADLFTIVPTGANNEYCAGIVREHAAVRHLIRVCNELIRDAHGRIMPASELVAQAERYIFAVAQQLAQVRDKIRPIGDVLRDVMIQIDERISAGGKLPGLSSGYVDLDELIGGFRPGELVVVGARPSVGKTALSLNIAARIAKSGAPVLFVSLEMPESELGGRLLSMGSGISMQRITRGSGLAPHEAESLVASSRGFGQCGLFIDDSCDQPASAIASTARRMVSRFGVKFIVVDYLQLMRPENPRENRTQQVGMLALRMKNMARDCGVPVMLLSQLNRDLEHGNRRPRLSDLRESGDIEAHADRVILLHRDPSLNPADAGWPIDVVVAKNRNGPIGDVRLTYLRLAMRFENYLAGIRE